MIKFENVEKLYLMVIDFGIKLSKDDIMSFGFTKEDIKELENCNILVDNNDDIIFSSSKELSEYGLHLIRKNGHCREATDSFKRAIEIDSSDSIARFRLFSEAVFNRDFDEAFKYFEKIYEEDNHTSPRVTKNNKLILYLFNYIGDIPTNYRKIAKSFQLKDLMLSDDEIKNSNMNLYNKVVEYTFKGNFYKALGSMQELKNKVRKLYGPELVMVRMLNAANAVRKSNIKTIDELILNDEYKEALKVLGGIGNKRQLTFMEYYQLKLLTDIRDIKEKGKTFEVTSVESYEPMHAIRHHDYNRALELQKKYNLAKGYSDEKCVFCHMLGDLVTLLDNNKTSQTGDKKPYQKKLSSGE